MYKRGVSGVVTSVLVILVSLIAAVILWNVIRPFTSNTSGASHAESCLSNTLRVASCSINYSNGLATVSIARTKGNAQLQALKFVFYGSNQPILFIKNDSLLGELETATFSFMSPDLLNAYSVDVAGLIGGENCQLTGAPLSCGMPGPGLINQFIGNNFNFSFGSDGYLSELNWTSNSGVKRVVWDELSGRYNGCTHLGCGGARYYLHSSLGDYGALGYWSYFRSSGAQVIAHHNDLTYTKTSVNNNSAVIDVDESGIHATDYWSFNGDSVQINISLRNKLNEKITKITIPVYFGGLIIGDYDSNFRLKNPTGISRLTPNLGGTIENNFQNNGGVRFFYPRIETFSPVDALWDSRITVGQQFLTTVYAPDQLVLMQKFEVQYTPALYSEIMTDLGPNEVKSYTVVFKVADGNKWQETLQPYKDWFSLTYGDAPTYCPTGPIDGFVASNAGPTFWDALTKRYKPGATLRGLTNADNTPTNSPDNTRVLMQNLGLNLFGLWQTPLSSTCLVGNGVFNLNSPAGSAACSRTSVPECVSTGNTQDCEFGAHTEFIDPNIDAGPNRTKIDDFTNAYAQNNINIFWYMRPCGDIYGIDVNYTTNTIKQGLPTGYADLDLRNITNRDRQVSRVIDLATHGVNGFYFDATGCPGDEAFFNYLQNNLSNTFPGRKFFYLAEGSRDRLALSIPQAPLLKLPDYSFNSSQLLFWLVPDATYYAGIFNSPLNGTANNNEFADVMKKGYQAIPLNFAPTLSVMNIQHEGQRWGDKVCNLVNQSYANRYQRYQNYGQSLGCPAVTQQPPWPNYPDCPI